MSSANDAWMHLRAHAESRYSIEAAGTTGLSLVWTFDVGGEEVLDQRLTVTAMFDGARTWVEVAAAICPVGAPYTAPSEMLDGIHILRYPAPPPASGIVSYVWEFLYCWLWTLWLTLKVTFGRGFDVIHAANPPDTFWAVALPFRWFGKRYVFDHHDLCPELYLARFGAGREGFCDPGRSTERCVREVHERGRDEPGTQKDRA